jgi:hypothetical protein
MSVQKVACLSFHELLAVGPLSEASLSSGPIEPYVGNLGRDSVKEGTCSLLSKCPGSVTL